jgi:hypothetical protein
VPSLTKPAGVLVRHLQVLTDPRTGDHTRRIESLRGASDAYGRGVDPAVARIRAVRVDSGQRGCPGDP